MEFIIANKAFTNCKNINDTIYMSGDYKISNGKIIIQDGFTIPPEVSVSSISNDDKEIYGCYNIITIDKETGIISLKSDKRTIIPIYKYENNGNFGISNNPWLLAKVFKDEIEINESSLLSQLVYWVDVNPDRTLIKNLSRIKAGEIIEYDIKKRTLKSNILYNFTYEPKENISLEEELEFADNQFTRYFEYIKDQNAELVTGFGCSGGLDSRLIAHYTNKVGINPKYYVIGDSRPNKILKSVTSIVSKEVANYYNHDIISIQYNIQWLKQSLLLDIRNHPFFFAQLFINPINDLPDYDVQFAGDPGGYAYLASPIMTSDLSALKVHADFFLGLRKDAQWGIIDKIRKTAGHLGLNIDQYKEEGFTGLQKSMIDRIIGQDIIQYARGELFDVINGAPGENNVEKWIYIHDNITTRYQYASAYDSMNLTKKYYPLYYPFFYEQIKHFPHSYLRNKFFLKNLLTYVNPDYKNIPDQNLNYINKKRGIVSKAVNRVELALRGRGLQIRDLMKEKEYINLYKSTYNKSNPIFEKYVNPQSILRSHIPYTYAGSQFLKLKMVVDYIYNKDFESLLSIDSFKIK